MDSTARTAQARMAALCRYRSHDDPELIEARHDYADEVARMRVARLTPQERDRLRAALAVAEPVNTEDR
ncbi:hypothetical protein ABZ770_42475 [Streptomyces sp. NPDC006654]|uniref:hypothetical protein n=1 Tax=Streptomyces sp. NPDC006654 TaxID=3156897 RepID=UPI0033F36FD6